MMLMEKGQTRDSFIEAIRSMRRISGDNKTFVSHEEMTVLLSWGARVVSRGRQISGGFFMEVEFRGLRFITVGQRNLAYLLRAKKSREVPR